MKCHFKTHNKGLTVIELLFAVAVLTILLALLVPALARGRAYAATVGCTSNLREIYAAYSQFIAENAYYLPPYREFHKDPNGKTINGTTWGAHLVPYYNKTAKLPTRCPGERLATVTTTYGMNSGMSYMATLEPLSDPPPEKLAGVSAPSQRFLITDSEGVIRVTPSKFDEEASFRHPGERINILFLDGHVESRTLSSIPLPVNGYKTTSPEYQAFWRGNPHP